MKNNGLKDLFKALPLVSQMGISLVVPPVFCFLICFWLVKQFHPGYWVFIPGFILGFGASATSAYKIYKNEMKKNRKDDKPVAFNDHS